MLSWWYKAELRGGGQDDEQESDLHLPQVTHSDEWRRLALHDLRRRRQAAGDILRGARARKGQRVVWSDSESDEPAMGHGAGAPSEGCVEARLRGGRPDNDASVRGSAGGESVAVAADAVERATGLDGVHPQVRA